MFTKVRLINAIGCCLICSVSLLSTAGATTLIQNIDPYNGDRYVGYLAIGWQQATSETNVSISVPLTYVNLLNVPPSQGPVLLTTLIGPSTTAADLVASTVVSVMPQLDLSTTDYTVFSGLNLSAGSYYLVLDTATSDGSGWDGYAPAQDSTTLSTAPGIKYLGAFYDTSPTPPSQPSDTFAPLIAAGPGLNNFIPGSLAFAITESSTSVVPEPGSLIFGTLGLSLLFLLTKKWSFR